MTAFQTDIFGNEHSVVSHVVPSKHPATRMSNVFATMHTDRDDSNEYYTPAAVVERARRTMGGIDLDPASCAEANRVVGAAQYYDADANGLMLPWYGRVWLNPPFERDLVEAFTDLLASAAITQFCCLTMMSNNARWWHRLLAISDMMCLIGGRDMRFWSPDGAHKDTSPMGYSVCYRGPNTDRFVSEFSDIGTMLEVYTESNS